MSDDQSPTAETGAEVNAVSLVVDLTFRPQVPAEVLRLPDGQYEIRFMSTVLHPISNVSIILDHESARQLSGAIIEETMAGGINRWKTVGAER